MKLCFRGNYYEVPFPIEESLPSQERSTQKLIYRGCVYHGSPRPVEAPRQEIIDGPTVTLIYRGCTYERQRRFLPPYQKSNVINWRWQWN
jgi:Domain of unknown function (DUF4278)